MPYSNNVFDINDKENAKKSIQAIRGLAVSI